MSIDLSQWAGERATPATMNQIANEIRQREDREVFNSIAASTASAWNQVSVQAQGAALTYETLRQAIDQLNNSGWYRERVTGDFAHGSQTMAEHRARARRTLAREEPTLLEVWRD